MALTYQVIEGFSTLLNNVKNWQNVSNQHNTKYLPAILLCSFALVIRLAHSADNFTQTHIQGKPAAVSASSELTSKDNRYSVLNLFDHIPTTAWVEGVPDNGIGEAITIKFDQPQMIYGVTIKPGYTKSTNLLLANATPQQLKLTLDDDTFTSHLLFDQEFSIERAQCELANSKINQHPQTIYFSDPKPRKTVKLELLAAVKGSKYKDTAISDIEFHFKPSTTLTLQKLNTQVILGNSEPGQVIWTSDQGWVTDKGKVSTELARLKVEHGEDAECCLERLYHTFPLPSSNKVAAYIQNNFLDAFVNQTSSRWISSNRVKIGDGEWVEVYKTLGIDSNKEIKDIQYRYTFDGSPGCSHYINEGVFE